MRTVRKVISIFSTVLLVLATVVVAFVFVLRLSGARPQFFGYYTFNVASDSMTPMLKVGDVILVKACEGSEVHKGDVITYHGTAGELAGKDITHKVIEEPVTDTGGTIRIQTQGIKPGTIKDPVFTGEQVIGKYVCTLHVLSFAFNLFKQWYGLLIFLAVIFVLMGIEIYNLAKLSKKAEKIEPLTEEQLKQILKEAEQKKRAEQQAPDADEKAPGDTQAR